MISKISALLDYCLIIFIFISTYSVFWVSSINNNLFRVLILGTTILLILINILKNGLITKVQELQAMLIYIIVSVALLIFNYLIYFPGVNLFIINNILLLISFWLLGSIYFRNNRIHLFMERVVNVTLILAIVSLFFWTLGSLLGFISPTGYIVTSWGDAYYKVSSYQNIYFETQKIKLLGFEGWRNNGIFIEGPMYNIVLSISLLYLSLFKTRIELKKIIILIIAIFSTFSTTGILLVAFIVFYKLFFRKRISKTFFFSLLIIFPMISSYGLRFISNLLRDKASTRSASIRLDDISAGVKSWEEHILFGNGYNNRQAIVSHMNLNIRPNVGFSNGILEILSDGGIVLFTMLFLPLLFFLFKSTVAFNTKVVILIWFILLFITIICKTPLFMIVCGLSYAALFHIDSSNQS